MGCKASEKLHDCPKLLYDGLWPGSSDNLGCKASENGWFCTSLRKRKVRRKRRFCTSPGKEEKAKSEPGNSVISTKEEEINVFTCKKSHRMVKFYINRFDYGYTLTGNIYLPE